MTRRAAGPWLGYLEAVGAACLWGSSGVFSVHLFRMGVPPESVALLRPAVGVLGLLVWAVAVRARSLRVPPGGLLVLFVLGGAAVGVFQVAYQVSTDAVGVPRTVALLYLAPAVVVIASGPILGERPTRTRIALALTTVTGVWISVAGAREVRGVFTLGGIEWGVLAALGYAAYTIFGRWATPRYGSVPTVVYSTAGACAVVAASVPFFSEPLTLPGSAAAWALLVAYAVLSISLAQLLFFDALGRIEADRAATSAAAEPAVAAVLATLLLGQGLRPAGWAGILLVVVGVAGVGLTARPATSPPPRRPRSGRS